MKKIKLKISDFLILNTTKVKFLPENLINLLIILKGKQDRQSQDLYERTRPPENSSIDYLYFRLFEVIPIEDIEELIHGIEKLFTKSTDILHNKNRIVEFIRNTSGIFDEHRVPIGVVVSDKGTRFYSSLVTKKKIPTFVDFISIELYKISASFFIIAFDVHLAESITKRLNEIQRGIYKPEITFNKLIPYGKMGGGYFILNPKQVMEKEISDWHSKLRHEVEVFLKTYFTGIFFNQKRTKNCYLPSFELYTCKGIPKEKKEIQKWFTNSVNWLQSIGFSNILSKIYSDKKIFYFPKFAYGNDRFNKSHKVIISYDPYLDSINNGEAARGDKNYFIQNVNEDFLDIILKPIAIIELLIFCELKFNFIWKKVFEQIRLKNFKGLLFNQTVFTSASVLWIGLLFNRIKNDFYAEKNDLCNFWETNLKYGEMKEGRRKKEEFLNVALSIGIEFRINKLENLINFSLNWMEKYLDIKNISVTYLFAIIAVIISSISILFTIINYR
jgi:hypothetical protein